MSLNILIYALGSIMRQTLVNASFCILHMFNEIVTAKIGSQKDLKCKNYIHNICCYELEPVGS